MRNFILLFSVPFYFTFIGFLGAETISLDGRSIPNCELVELSPEGAIYKSNDSGELHLLPWEQLTPVQKNVISSRHHEALVNVICQARYIKGTVFSGAKEGVIVQVDVTPEGAVGTNGYLKGAKVLRGGSILVSDLPLDVPRGAGAPIEIIGYFKEPYLFDIVIGKTEIDHVTVAKPEWFQETDWTSAGAEGLTMKAKLLGVNPEGKALFLKSGQKLVLELSRLDDASQEKARKIQEKLAKYPVPSR